MRDEVEPHRYTSKKSLCLNPFLISVYLRICSFLTRSLLAEVSIQWIRANISTAQFDPEQPASIALPLTRPISIDEFQLHDVNPLPVTSPCHRSSNVHPRNVYLRFHVRVRAVRSIATRVPARITCKTRGKTRLFIAKRMRPTGVSVCSSISVNAFRFHRRQQPSADLSAST